MIGAETLEERSRVRFFCAIVAGVFFCAFAGWLTTVFDNRSLADEPGRAKNIHAAMAEESSRDINEEWERTQAKAIERRLAKIEALRIARAPAAWNEIQPKIPPPNRNVLVWCERGVVIGYHNGLGDWYCEPLEEEPKPWRLKIKEPTHWCPIPDPPGPC